MNIAIVDDRTTDREEVSACLKEYMDRHHLSYTLFLYESGEEFLRDFVPGHFQIVFMDIYMDGMDGIETAKKMRQTDRRCKLIFLTVTEDFARAGYSVSAIYYLVKPVNTHMDEFCEAMNLCQSKPVFEVPALTIQFGGRTMQLPTEDILYIDFQSRCTRIHTASHVIPVDGGFLEVTSDLEKDRRFLQCFRSIVVNMDYIKDTKGSAFLLNNGEEIPMTIRNTKQLQNTWKEYVFSAMGGEARW